MKVAVATEADEEHAVALSRRGFFGAAAAALAAAAAPKKTYSFLFDNPLGHALDQVMRWQTVGGVWIFVDDALIEHDGEDAVVLPAQGAGKWIIR